MKKPIGDRVIPVHRNDLEQRVDLPPVVDGHEDVLGIFALVKYIDVEHLEVHDVNLGMVSPFFARTTASLQY